MASRLKRKAFAITKYPRYPVNMPTPKAIANAAPNPAAEEIPKT